MAARGARAAAGAKRLPSSPQGNSTGSKWSIGTTALAWICSMRSRPGRAVRHQNGDCHSGWAQGPQFARCPYEGPQALRLDKRQHSRVAVSWEEATRGFRDGSDHGSFANSAAPVGWRRRSTDCITLRSDVRPCRGGERPSRYTIVWPAFLEACNLTMRAWLTSAVNEASHESTSRQSKRLI
jgi:hypothetical protein